jgi:hypothetical protein
LTDTEALLRGGTYAASTAEFWASRPPEPSDWSQGYAAGAQQALKNVLAAMFGTRDLARTQEILGDLAVRAAKSKGGRKGGLSRSPAKVNATRANAAKARAARDRQVGR